MEVSYCSVCGHLDVAHKLHIAAMPRDVVVDGALIVFNLFPKCLGCAPENAIHELVRGAVMFQRR